MRRLRVTAVLLTGVLLVGCAPDPVVSGTSMPTAPEPSVSADAAPQPDSTPGDTPSPAPSKSECWTVDRPDVAVDSVQTPEQFAEQNRALVDAGAPAPCSLFATGSHLDEADAWLEGLLADGWTDQGVVQDDVYVSRSAMNSSGATASYLVSRDAWAPNAISQFQLY